MTHDELTELDRLIEFEPHKIDDFFGELLTRSPGSRYEAGSLDVYVHMRPQADIGDTLETFDVDLAALLIAAGMGPAARAARDKATLAAQAAGGHTPLTCYPPDEAFAQMQEAHNKFFADEPQDPGQQAAAALRLLCGSFASPAAFARGNSQDYDWVRALAMERLTELMVAYPALLHHRLVWDAYPESETWPFLPLVHTLLSHCANGIVADPGEHMEHNLKPLATHQALYDALHDAAPVGVGRGNFWSTYQGTAVLDMLWEEGQPDVEFSTSLMLLERLRTQERATLFPRHERDKVDKGIAGAFTTTIVCEPTPLSRAFIRELKKNPDVKASSLRDRLLQTSLRVLGDPDDDGEVRHYADYRARLPRLASVLVELGLAKTAADAAELIARNIFHGKTNSGPEFSEAPGVMTTDSAIEFMRELAALGLSIEDSTAIMVHAGDITPPFRAAIDAFYAEKTMRAAINTAAPEPVAANSSTRHRRSL